MDNAVDNFFQGGEAWTVLSLDFVRLSHRRLRGFSSRMGYRGAAVEELQECRATDHGPTPPLVRGKGSATTTSTERDGQAVKRSDDRFVAGRDSVT